MKIIATSEELKDLRNLFIQGFTSLDDKDREQFNKEVKRLNNIISNKANAIKELQQANNDLIYKLNQNRAIVTRLETTNNDCKIENVELITANQILKKSVDELTDVISLKERDIKDLVDKNNELKNELEQARKSSYIQGTTKEIFTMPQDKVREYNEKTIYRVKE